MEIPDCIQCRPWSDATLCGVWSGSALFAYDPFKGFQVRMSQQIQVTNTHYPVEIYGQIDRWTHCLSVELMVVNNSLHC